MVEDNYTSLQFFFSDLIEECRLQLTGAEQQYVLYCHGTVQFQRFFMIHRKASDVKFNSIVLFVNESAALIHSAHGQSAFGASSITRRLDSATKS